VNESTINLVKVNEAPIDIFLVCVNIARDTLTTLCSLISEHDTEYAIMSTALNIDTCIMETVGAKMTPALNEIRCSILYDVAFNLKSNFFSGEDDKEEALEVLVSAINKLRFDKTK